MTWRCGGWDVCPYGHICWVLPVITFFATWLFLFPAFRCSLTVSRSSSGDLEIWYGYWNLESSEFAIALGPEEDSNVCVKWGKGSRDVFDAAWKLGKAVGVIGVFTTVPMAATNCMLFFSRFDIGWFYPIIAIHVLNAFLSFMLLIGLTSELCVLTECKLARAGYVAIIAGCLWLLAACIYVIIRRKEGDMSAHPQGVDLKDVELEEEVLALPGPESARNSPYEVEEYLALPAPGDEEEATKSPRKPSSSRSTASKRSPKPSSMRSDKKSPKPSSGRSTTSPRGSPRKGTRPDRSKSPKKGARTPEGSNKGRKRATRPAEIPEI